MQLKRTDLGIFYLHDYIPVRLFPNYPEEAVAKVANHIGSDRFGLVAVPPSKVGKMSTIRFSIWKMVNWYNQGMVRKYLNCSKVFYNYSNFIENPVFAERLFCGSR